MNQLPGWAVILILVLTPLIILYAFGDLKPNGEYDCGERSPILAEEQLRVVCENQHYNITGKNKTTIGGVETYCCPSPWLPDAYGSECSDPGVCGAKGDIGPSGPPPFGAIGFGKGEPTYLPYPYEPIHFTPCYPHPNTFKTICKDDVMVVTGYNGTIIPLVGNIDFYHIHDYAKAKHTLTLIMKDGRVVEIG